MATRDLTKVDDQVHVRTLSWIGLLQADDGTPIELEDHADKSVQVVGTFGVGGSINLEGSNDGTNYVVLTDPQGNALTFTAAGLEQILEITQFIRPNVTAGDGTTDLDVFIHVRSNR